MLPDVPGFICTGGSGDTQFINWLQRREVKEKSKANWGSNNREVGEGEEVNDLSQPGVGRELVPL